MSKLSKIINPHFESYWNGGLSKQFRLYLSRNQLDEKQLKFLLENCFVEGIGLGSKITKSIFNETLITKEISCMGDKS